MIAALLLALQPPPAAAAEADGAMLDAFQTACARIGSIEQALADAQASGWVRADAGDPRVARLTTPRLHVHHLVPPAFFRREVAGRELLLAISHTRGQGYSWWKDCRLYHFEATAPIDLGLLERWAGRPLATQDLPELGLRTVWEPEWWQGVSFAITHVSADSRLRGREGLQGTVLVAQVNGGL